MNPLTNVKNISKLNELELEKGTVDKKSWHDMYKDSAWIFIGGLAYGLTEGDILAVFSQYGEIVNINLVRDKKTGKTKGFCFLCYANQKSTILAVDNFNGIKLCNRTIRVDHVSNYKPPKEDERDDEVTKILKSEGCAPKSIKAEKCNDIGQERTKSKKKHKKEKKEHRMKKRNHSASERESYKNVKVKVEKSDPGYDKYDFTKNRTESTKGKHHIDERSHLSHEEASSGNQSDDYRRKMKHKKHKRDIEIHKKRLSNNDNRRDYDFHKSSKHSREDSKHKYREKTYSSSDDHDSHCIERKSDKRSNFSTK